MPIFPFRNSPTSPEASVPSDERDARSDTSVKTRPETKKPSMYKVFLLNDDYTPMDFVVQILEIVFNKSREDATAIMLQVHTTGSGLCGVYTYEIAETKTAQVLSASRQAQYPLQCSMEKE